MGRRHKTVNATAANLMKRGFVVFSPLTHTIPLSQIGVWDDFDWLKPDLEILSVCTAMIIIDIDGWKRSKGIKREIDFAKKHSIPIFHINPKE
jgi:hypothetical protein